MSIKTQALVVTGVFVLLTFAGAASAAESALWLRTPAISPDGGTVAFSYRGDIWTVAAEGGDAARLTVHGAHDFIPVWSRDGRWLAFASDRPVTFGGYHFILLDSDEINAFATGKDPEHASVAAFARRLVKEQDAGRPLEPGFHRRNLVVAGLVPKHLREQRVQIGEALFVWHRPRPPCGYLDRVSGVGMARALGKGGGSCLRVLSGGLIRVGDPVMVLDPR